MSDNKKYTSYSKLDEWDAFFKAMKNIVKQISSKVSHIEDEYK